jgi:predicted RNA-binding protein YlqC (UPF0109 family)
MNNSIDQQFIEYVVKSLVGKPDEVKVERSVDEKGVLLELTVDPEDLGRVIGKRGATAQSLRTLLRALGTKNDARYNLKIIDNGVAPVRDDAPASATPVKSKKSDKPADDTASDDVSTDKSDVVEDLAEDTEVDLPNDDDRSDSVSRTRKELADLDDLDI